MSNNITEQVRHWMFAMSSFDCSPWYVNSNSGHCSTGQCVTLPLVNINFDVIVTARNCNIQFHTRKLDGAVTVELVHVAYWNGERSSKHRKPQFRLVLYIRIFSSVHSFDSRHRDRRATSYTANLIVCFYSAFHLLLVNRTHSPHYTISSFRLC